MRAGFGKEPGDHRHRWVAPGILLLATVACIATPAAWSASPASVPAAVEGPDANALMRDARTPQNVVTYGMGYGVQRYSPLRQINTGTVANLVPAWSITLEDDRGQESQPLLYKGVLYLTTHKATFAIDARSGRRLWKNELRYPRKMLRVVCCGMINRGAVIYDGKVFRQTLDNTLQALDAATGDELWRVKVSDWADGYTMTGTPLVANGVIIIGTAGGDMGTRGFLEGRDPDTGKLLWHFWTTAGPDDPGGDTWQGDAYLHGGGATWLSGSYDPELDLVYWGIGNPGPWNGNVRPGDNLYTDSVVALRPKTGEMVWHYQYVPHDNYDYDGVNELIHATLTIGGKPRKVIMTANRNGFLYVLDRATGELLRANQYVDKLTWADGLDPKTGHPVISQATRRNLEGKETVVWPSNIGGKNWAPASFNPDTGLMYLNGFELSMNFKPLNVSWRRGMMYVAADFSFNVPEGGPPLGYLRAVDPLTGKRVWQVPYDPPANGGTLSTAGGLVFTGLQTGEEVAHDARTGKKLWSYQTGSGIIAPPITYELDGTQYLAVVSGMGGLLAWHLPHPELGRVNKGGLLTVFRLFTPYRADD